MAMAILAILSLGIVTALIVSGRQGEMAWHTRAATDLAVSRLEVERYAGPLQAVSANGYSIELTEDKTPLQKTVTVNVSWQQYNVTENVSLSRVILK